MSDDSSNNKRPIWHYFLMGIVILVVLNILLIPSIVENSTLEMSYSQFIDELEAENVEDVILGQGRIKFRLKDRGQAYQFQTGDMSSDDLVERLEEAGVKNYKKEIPREPSPFLTLLLGWILPMILLYAFFRWMMNQASKSMSNQSGLGMSGAKEYELTDSSKTFDDVAGQEEAKESLSEIVEYLSHPEKYKDIGAKLPKGVLLVGPPGTGKTLLAQALAGEAKVPFFSISGSEFVQLFVGMGATKVRDLFKTARKNAPCIIFIDEIDAIGKRRDTSGLGSNDEREQTLNQLLSEMDGFEGTEGVVIIGATNRPEILDPALTRPGRFDRQIRVELPDLQGRIEILKVHTRNIRTAEDIDYKQVALMTAGASGAQLANIANEAALRAVRQGRREVTTEDLHESVETVIAGQEKKNAVLNDQDKELVAYHEVGHALVAAKQTNSAPVRKITIIPRTSGALGYTMQVEEEERYLMSQEELFNKIVTLTGGRCAEELIFNTRTTGASNDIEVATKYARAMVTQYGMTDEFGMVQMETESSRYLGGDTGMTVSSGTADKVDDKVRQIIQEAHDKAYQILEDNEDKLHQISQYLIEKETITGEEFMEILNREEMPEEIESK